MIYIAEKEEIIRKNNDTTDYSRAFFKNQKENIKDKLFVYGSGLSGHGYLVKNDNKLYCFGKNSFSQLGLGDNNNRNQLAVLEIPNKKVKKAACGCCHTIFLTTDNEAYSCGYNEYGQLGLNDKIKRRMPTPVRITQENETVEFLDVFAGGFHSVLLSTLLEVYSFGSNWAGELGLGDNIKRFTPTKVFFSEKIISISCGLNHTCFISINGNVYVTGKNDCGQLGIKTKNLNKPKELLFFKEKGIIQICCGKLTSDNHVFGSGRNEFGELGIKKSKFYQHQRTPALVSKLKEKKIFRVKCGSNHTFFFGKKKIWMSGYNKFGQLGTDDFKNVHSPKLFSIQGKKIVESLILAYSSIHFTKKEVYGAGLNRSGELFCGKFSLINPILKTHDDLKVKRRNFLNSNESLDRFEFILKNDKESCVCLC